MELCGGTLPVPDPERTLTDYLTTCPGRAYDTLVTNGSAELVTGDLLAPALLEVHVDSARFSVLASMFDELEAGLAALPDVALADADDEQVAQVGRVFAVLDRREYARSGVRGTIVSKVLHRKRPELVPLYDSRIWTAYAVLGPIPRAERTWVDFITLLCREMRADLRREAAGFAALRDVAAGHGVRLTPLRILDILVWMSTRSPV